ncbi:dihydrodipicolinate synthase family protein [Rhizobium rhizoryzae]|uniref:4-hydroxy-tetrahydrodipicolinate synthase n=1 Tax=Rhizobium rhizoryzae TaxID=451876 RepID=A0A7W6LLC5_9HYPH|nr:dihydrodipicolinate synthase family protein [Rhizobium rhizoryzae]MBB4145508.1 4-hydroxy-tetrahydrodipicolinate synthase [Rhizobium rhizoryzae]
MSRKFGLSAALTTPFDETGNILLPMLTEHARFCLNHHCDSVTVFGTTGEGSSIGHSERGKVLSALQASGISGANIVAGVLVDSVIDAVEQSAQALDLGARNILLAPPSYFKNVSDDGLFTWFSAVFAGLGSKARDIIVYNIPSVTMVKISVDLVARLRSAFPGIVTGVKDSGGDWTHTERLLKEHGDLAIMIGDERHLAQGTRLGGQGAISGMANLLGADVRAMAVDGRDDDRVTGLVEVLLNYPVTPAVKVLVAHTSGNGVWLNVRPPLITIAAQDRDRICSVFDQAFSEKAA